VSPNPNRAEHMQRENDNENVTPPAAKDSARSYNGAASLPCTVGPYSCKPANAAAYDDINFDYV